jgi:hypothetical protein
MAGTSLQLWARYLLRIKEARIQSSARRDQSVPGFRAGGLITQGVNDLYEHFGRGGTLPPTSMGPHKVVLRCPRSGESFVEVERPWLNFAGSHSHDRWNRQDMPSPAGSRRSTT